MEVLRTRTPLAKRLLWRPLPTPSPAALRKVCGLAPPPQKEGGSLVNAGIYTAPSPPYSIKAHGHWLLAQKTRSQLWAMGVGESQLWEGAEQPNNVMPQQLMPSAAGSIRRKTINKVTLSN